MAEDPWTSRKRAFLRRLERERRQGRVDEDIVPLLRAINALDDYYTTSSCSGRIQVVAAEFPGDKWNMVTLAKWHRPVEPEEVVTVVRHVDYPNLWFSMQPPILHVICRTPAAAIRLVKLARASGFKRAGLQGARKNRYPVEIMGTERIETPLRLSGVWVVREEALPLLVRAANMLLVRSKERIERLRRAIEALAAEAP